MSPEDFFFVSRSGESIFFINKYECNTYREKSRPCSSQMKSVTEQETYDNSEMEGKKNLSIKNTSPKCLRIFTVKIFGKSCRTLAKIVGGEDAGTVKSICTLERTPLKCSCKKYWIQCDKRIHILRKESEEDQSGAIN